MKNEQIISLNKFVSDAEKFVKSLNSSQQPLILTKDDSAVAIVHDIDHYRKITNALYMLKLMVQGENDIRQEKLYDESDVFKEIDLLLQK